MVPGMAASVAAIQARTRSKSVSLAGTKEAARNDLKHRRVGCLQKCLADFFLERGVEPLAESPHIFRNIGRLREDANRFRIDFTLPDQPVEHRLREAAGGYKPSRDSPRHIIVAAHAPQRVVAPGGKARLQELMARHPSARR